MITFLYRWRVKPEMADQFVENWSIVTEHYRANCGSLGSRLHRGSDGLYYGYAQWPSREVRDAAVQDERAADAFAAMQEAVEERFPDVRMEVLSDFLIPEG